MGNTLCNVDFKDGKIIDIDCGYNFNTDDSFDIFKEVFGMDIYEVMPFIYDKESTKAFLKQYGRESKEGKNKLYFEDFKGYSQYDKILKKLNEKFYKKESTSDKFIRKLKYKVQGKKSTAMEHASDILNAQLLKKTGKISQEEYFFQSKKAQIEFLNKNIDKLKPFFDKQDKLREHIQKNKNKYLEKGYEYSIKHDIISGWTHRMICDILTGKYIILEE